MIENNKVSVQFLPSQKQFIESKKKECLFSGAFRAGKEQPYDATVYTPNGPKTMGELLVGEHVLTPFGTSSEIEYISEQGEKDIYAIRFSDGNSVECGLEHLWEVKWEKAKHKHRMGKNGGILYFNEEQTSVLSTKQLLEGIFYNNCKYKSKYMPRINGRPYIDITQPTLFKEQKITIHPYILGVLIGDGYLGNGGVNFTTNDSEIKNKIERILKEEYTSFDKLSYNNKLSYNVIFKRPPKQGRTGKGHIKYNLLKKQLEEVGLYDKLSHNKFIPKNYIYNSQKIRLELLRGLMDTDGWHEKKAGACYFGSTSKQLALDAKELTESLGIDCCNFKQVTKICTNSKTKNSCEFYIFRLSCNNASFLFNLQRKKDVANKYSKGKYPTKRYIVSIGKNTNGLKKCRCIKIKDDRSLYLTNNFIPTHNSRVLCYALVKQVIRNPNNTVLLCRRTLESLKGTTLNTLLRGDNNDPVLPLGSYTHNKAEKFIQLNGGGRMNYRGIDDILKVRSMSLGAIGIDEAIEFELDEYLELLGRLSLPSGTRQIYMATNPGVPSHWLFQRFLKEPHKDREVIKSRTVDNYFLPPDYIESLKELPKQMYDRYALGEWTCLENQIYSQFDRAKHIKTRAYGEFSKYMLGLDFGFTNPTAVVLYGIDGDNNMHLLKEHKKSKLLIGDIVDLCEQYHRLEPIVVVDPSAPALIAEFEKAGFNVKKADNSVDSGIARMQNYLHNGKLTFDPACFETVKEIESYIYNDKGKPVKINDHLLDASRYAIQELVESSGDSFCPIVLT